jgi:short-subunit dehydrogenase
MSDDRASNELKGRWALVTGASSGLGADFSRELARRGANVAIVARREENLRALADELAAARGVTVEPVAMDLGSRDGVAGLVRRLEAAGVVVDVLVNNAGFGVYGSFLDQPWERVEAMLELDVVTVAHLTRLLAPGMVARRWGRILQVASIGAFQATPTYAAYSAAKAFVLLFGEALDAELQGSGVSCTVLSPGVTATEFLDTAGNTELSSFQRRSMMRSEDVARIGIDAMMRGKRSVIPGALNALNTWSERFLSRRATTYLAGKLMSMK